MKAKIYFIRHGETIANKDNVLQGHCDYPLTMEGRLQAVELGERLMNHMWTHFYSSDLPRAVTSAELILAQAKYHQSNDIKRTSLLRELSFGLREGLSRTLSMTEVRKIKSEQLNIPEEELVDTTETTESVTLRQKMFLKDLFQDLRQIAHHNSDLPFRIAVVSHGGFIKLFLRSFCNYISSEKIGNCSASIVNIEWTEEGNDESFRFYIDSSEINMGPSSTSIP